VILPHLLDPVPLYLILVIETTMGLYRLWPLVPPVGRVVLLVLGAPGGRCPAPPGAPDHAGPGGPVLPVELDVSSIVLLMYPIIHFRGNFFHCFFFVVCHSKNEYCLSVALSKSCLSIPDSPAIRWISLGRNLKIQK